MVISHKTTITISLTEAIATLSGNSLIPIDMVEVSQAVPPNAPTALHRRLDTTNAVAFEIQAQKLQAITCEQVLPWKANDMMKPEK